MNGWKQMREKAMQHLGCSASWAGRVGAWQGGVWLDLKGKDYQSKESFSSEVVRQGLHRILEEVLQKS